MALQKTASRRAPAPTPLPHASGLRKRLARPRTESEGTQAEAPRWPLAGTSKCARRGRCVPCAVPMDRRLSAIPLIRSSGVRGSYCEAHLLLYIPVICLHALLPCFTLLNIHDWAHEPRSNACALHTNHG
eukprot:6201807-Pleurochrysis_carterae.AAC.1